MCTRPPRSTRTAPLFPAPTLLRSTESPHANFRLQRERFAPSLHHRGMEHPMWQTAIPVTPRSGESDAALVERARRGEGGAFEAIMRRYNRRSEEHTSELQSLMRISYAVFCLKNKIKAQSQRT